MERRVPPPAVTVVDYGVGNLFSVRRAFEQSGAEVHLTSTPADILAAQRLVLPGVGAFGNAMRELQARALVEPLRAYARLGRPFLGICLGMQLMLDGSEEFGSHEGLGLVPGVVRAIPRVAPGGVPHKVPHIGWNDLLKAPGASWSSTLLDGIAEGAAVYFVHSYTAFPDSERHRLADCDYDGCRLSAVVRSGHLYGCQFHPEKSGEIGLSMLRNFLALDGR
jgi:glutamine amidotransferase